jgi:hypothetical protein
VSIIKYKKRKKKKGNVVVGSILGDSAKKTPPLSPLSSLSSISYILSLIPNDRTNRHEVFFQIS